MFCPGWRLEQHLLSDHAGAIDHPLPEFGADASCSITGCFMVARSAAGGGGTFNDRNLLVGKKEGLGHAATPGITSDPVARSLLPLVQRAPSEFSTCGALFYGLCACIAE